MPPTDVFENFEGGKFKYYYEHWKKYTSGTFILDIIKNRLKLDLNEIPSQRCCNNFPFSKEEMSVINSKIQKLESKKVTVNIDKKAGYYSFGVFTRSKKYGSHRMILNLKIFNKFNLERTMMRKLNYQMKYGVNSFGRNISLKILFSI